MLGNVNKLTIWPTGELLSLVVRWCCYLGLCDPIAHLTDFAEGHV